MYEIIDILQVTFLVGGNIAFVLCIIGLAKTIYDMFKED